ncbi:hypothetical protein CVD25_08245 [Bacillus canaveralius]|uniref:Uncharacterized protein n=1 Tax=Bacillus canaveralius TaxID=1403243 RepID=A0A2N5GIM2_9BACI|nr:hypothetical protein CU635_17125 [Bacillus canaveralius]PLR84328.1 hypothetical protein CVD23_12160 [Bacillus sp. V33-4]PLR98401.1 hypothetical protein CVD25_08245 [Bacillus canaveralius]RSK52983.1 Fur-regulated basic protein FbpA [Bacillus canaveralius]
MDDRKGFLFYQKPTKPIGINENRSKYKVKKIDCSAELEKEIFIAKLLDLGIYKKGDRQLFELSLDDLTEEYERIMNVKIFE